MNTFNNKIMDISRYSPLSEPPHKNISMDYLNSQTDIPLNSRLNFEQRVLNPGSYPGLQLRNGSVASHLMSYNDMTDREGKPFYMVYPNVVQQGDKLIRLEPRDAIKYALENTEYRRFNTPEEAEYYTKYYKDRFWGKGDGTNMEDFVNRTKGIR